MPESCTQNAPAHRYCCICFHWWEYCFRWQRWFGCTFCFQTRPTRILCTYFANFGTTLDASQPVHPCFLYESLWCLLGFVLLAIFAKKIRRYDGQIFLIYICWYGAERAVVESLRTDSLVIGNVRVSQILAITCVVISVILQIAIGTKVKRMGVDYRMYKDTNESKQMLAEYEAAKFVKEPEDDTNEDTASTDEVAETDTTDSSESDETPAETDTNQTEKE